MKTIPYKDPSLPVKTRVEDLLARMTLAEKIGQLCQVDGRHDPDGWLFDRHVGSFLHVTGDEQVALQKRAEKTRLGIPILFGIDAIHGHAFQSGATVYPSQLALACSFEPLLCERVARATAVEVAATGLHWTFSPVLCMGRDLRWGRVDETFGEDPFLIGRLGAAMIRGYQKKALSDPDAILACAKHYVAYGESYGGRDSAEAPVSRRSLLETFLPPFEEAVRAGVATIMAGYHAIDGIPCSSHRWLMVDLLKDSWGFEGFVVTDWNNVGTLHTHQRVAATSKEAARLALEAGQDLIMSTPSFYADALALVEEGQVSEAVVDQAVKRILTKKIQLGLFDHKRYPDPSLKEKIFCQDHQGLALESAAKSMVLLKNEGGLLPLDPEVKIALIGPTIDDVQAHLGDWSFGTREHPERPTLSYHPEYDISKIVTIKDAFLKRQPQGLTASGCDLFSPSREAIEEAVSLAKKADVICCVVGDTNTLNGETRDRVDTRLTGDQEALVEALSKLKKPLVVISLSGKPLLLEAVTRHASALIQCFNPGMFGGEALWSLLFGERAFSGRLPISFPKHMGQQPTYYNQLPGWHTDRYVEMDARPLFAFGEGLSTTDFALTDLTLSKERLGPGETATLSVTLTNTGRRWGSTVVQLYATDLVASITRPIKELKGFERVELPAGQRCQVTFSLDQEMFSFVHPDLTRKVEAGDILLKVGLSSKDEDLAGLHLTLTE